MSIVDKLLEAEGAIQSEVRVPDLDRLLHEAASEIETIAAVNAELLEALRTVQAAFRSGDDGGNDWFISDDGTLQEVIAAAIAKARGTDNA